MNARADKDSAGAKFKSGCLRLQLCRSELLVQPSHAQPRHELVLKDETTSELHRQ